MKVNNVEMDANWKKFFDLTGMKKEDMLNEATAKLIYDLIEKRGGIENLIRNLELNRKSGPAAPGENE